MDRRVRIGAENKVLALTAALAGVAGVVGSYAAVGFTQSFVASPIEHFLTRWLPNVIVRYAITILGHIGDRLNLAFALVLGVVILGVLSGVGLVAGRRLDSVLAGIGLAGVLCGLAVAVIAGSTASALGGAVGAALVVAVAGLAATTSFGDSSVSGERRRALGSIASAFGVAIGGYLIGRQQVGDSSGSDTSLQDLKGVSGDPNGTRTDGLAGDATTSATTRPTDGGASTTATSGGNTGPDDATSTAGSDTTGENGVSTTDGTRDTPTAESDTAGSDTTKTQTTGSATQNGGSEVQTSASDTETSAGGTTTTEPSVKPTIDGMLAAAKQRSLGVKNLDGLVSDGFYEVDIDNANPNVDTDSWSLSVTGAVDSKRTFSYDDVTAIGAENRFTTLRCVSDHLNGGEMDNALWTGIPVMALLEDAGLPEECCVTLRAADDYYETFPLSALRDGFLAYGMNGDLLPRAHGAPVRALIPGHWGEINVKWLTEMQVRKKSASSYWEKKGWHGTGPVNTVAKLHATNRPKDGRIQVAGHAYAGIRGIKKVEVSTDGGNSWNDATLSEALPPSPSERKQGNDHAIDAWRQWAHTYDSPGNSHKVVVRATDGKGDLQPKGGHDPYPSGASGWVSKTIDG